MLTARQLVVLLALGSLVVPARPAAADEGPWVWPLAGAHEVARSFAPAATTYAAGHRGADLPSVEGAAVRASAAGRVTYVGLLAGRGVLVVTHGALRTTYEPVAASVRVGQQVALGQTVGRLTAGHLGCPVAACLHWGLRRGQAYLDPVRLVERGPVRLLPPGGAAADAARRAAPVAPDAPRVQGAARPPAPEPERLPTPPETGEPSWSLRAAEAPLGAAAVVALVLGVGLLARPRPWPDGPVSGGVASTSPEPQDEPQDEPLAEPGLLLHLDAARARREAAS